MIHTNFQILFFINCTKLKIQRKWHAITDSHYLENTTSLYANHVGQKQE